MSSENEFNIEEIYGEPLENIHIYKDFDSYNQKPVCIFGVLLTEEGIKIKESMLDWLKPNYNVYIVEQDVPGELFEYPAIRFMQYICLKDNIKYCLYLHTKGAGRPHLGQKMIRALWKEEFTNHKEEYIKNVDVDFPAVFCPFTGEDKTTWFDGFFVNLGALEVLILPDSANRHYFENMFKYNRRVTVTGRIYNDIVTANRDKFSKYLIKMLENYDGY